MPLSPPKVFRYQVNQKLRSALHRIMGCLTAREKEQRLDLQHEQIKTILLVRATFRMGDSLLAIPAVWSFRKRFPNSRIDFVGAPISADLFKNLPINNLFAISRRYPGSAFDYPVLLWRLRSVGYDLAVDVSCAQSAMGSFLVGFSRARFRIGLRGKWDRWFNIRIDKQPEINKYKTLPNFLRSLGLECDSAAPSLTLSSAEIENSRGKLRSSANWDSEKPIIGVFVGGRKSWGKRWPIKSFCELITALHSLGLNVVAFIGPEEKDSIGYYRDALDRDIPIVFEPSPRGFAVMVSACDLFVTCDSGPMHLAYALGTSTVAIFRYTNFDRWGPPADFARIVYQPGGCSAEEVLQVCCEELSAHLGRVRDLAADRTREVFSLASTPSVRDALIRLDNAVEFRRLSSLSSALQICFVILTLIYEWIFPSTGLFAADSRAEEFADVIGFATLVVAGLLHLWATSHATITGSNDFTAAELITTGPYAYIRYPRYLANLLIGLGMIFLTTSVPLAVVLIVLSGWHQRVVIPVEERLLEKKFGSRFLAYRDLVSKYLPKAIPQTFVFKRKLHFREFSILGVIFLVAFALEWFESPFRRDWVFGLYHWMHP